MHVAGCYLIVVYREGCTAIVEVQQASTDTCTFFNQAYVLCAGEVVYHGGSNEQAMAMLGGSGMPCPPLYHPIEQYMRLIDPSFEVSCSLLCLPICVLYSMPSLHAIPLLPWLTGHGRVCLI